METLNTSLVESELRQRIGFVLIKPDAIELGIDDFVINYLQSSLQAHAELNGIYVVKVKQENVKGIYSAAKMYESAAVINYVTSGNSIVATFSGNGLVDLWATLKNMKGKKLIDRTDEELEGSMGWRKGIRNAIPIPSTKTDYKPVFEKIKEYKLEATNYFTRTEFDTFVKNLVHTPDNLMEFYSLVKLLKPKEISYELSPFNIFRIKQELQIR